MYLKAVFKHCLWIIPPPSTFHPPTPESSRLPFLTRKGAKGKDAICIESPPTARIPLCISSAHTTVQCVEVLCEDRETRCKEVAWLLHVTVCQRQCHNANSHFKIINKTSVLLLKEKKNWEAWNIKIFPFLHSKLFGVYLFGLFSLYTQTCIYRHDL